MDDSKPLLGHICILQTRAETTLDKDLISLVFFKTIIPLFHSNPIIVILLGPSKKCQIFNIGCSDEGCKTRGGQVGAEEKLRRGRDENKKKDLIGKVENIKGQKIVCVEGRGRGGSSEYQKSVKGRSRLLVSYPYGLYGMF